jgi:hypothetical protein
MFRRQSEVAARNKRNAIRVSVLLVVGYFVCWLYARVWRDVCSFCPSK